MIIETFFPYLIAIHVGTIFFIAALILWADYSAFAWIRGKVPVLERKRIFLIHTLVWCGLIIMIISGGLLFYPYRDFLATLITFRIKMLFVAALVLNSFYIGNILPIAAQKPFAALTRTQKIKLGVSGVVSLVSWIGAIVAGNMLEV